MTGWSLCKLCRAVTWKDAQGRTFGCAVGCSNARSNARTRAPLSPTRAPEPAFEVTQPQGSGERTAFSADDRGSCRPKWSGGGTGNFTIPQSARFPPQRRRPGEGLSYDISGKIGERKRAAASSFKDKGNRSQVEKTQPPPSVGPATYLRHRMDSGVEGSEFRKVYSAGGAGMCAKASRDIYGPGGMANLGLVSSPKSTNAYVDHDSNQTWNKRLGHNRLGWVSKGSSFGKSNRFKPAPERAPPPGQYHDLHSQAFSSVRLKQSYVDLDQGTVRSPLGLGI